MWRGAFWAALAGLLLVVQPRASDASIVAAEVDGVEPVVSSSAPEGDRRSRRGRKSRRRKCMVGVCVSGALRSMASRAVQQAFLHAMDALGDEECQVELMAHVAVTNLPSIGFEPSPQQVHETLEALNATGKVVAVSYFDVDRHFAVPNTCGTGLPPMATYHQLYKVAACYHSCVLPRERQLGRRFDWLVRARWDLGWITPPPPVTVLTKDRVHVPYNYWPLSDQFAVVPRHLAAGYFEAVRSFYRCISPMEQFEWFPNGVGESDMLLTKHLVDNEIPYSYIEVNAPIARPSADPAAWCSGSLRTLLAPCLVLSGAKLIDWSVEYCQHSVSTILECACALRFRNLNEELGVPGPRQLPFAKHNSCEDFPSPPRVLDREWTDDAGEIMLILGAIGTHGGEHVSGVAINSTEGAMRGMAQAFADTVAAYGLLSRELSVDAAEPYVEDRVHSQHQAHWDALARSAKDLGSTMQDVFATGKYSIQLNEINPIGMSAAATAAGGLTQAHMDAALFQAQAQYTPSPTDTPWVAQAPVPLRKPSS